MTVLGVHGYGFIGSAADLYAQWSASLGQNIQGFEWYSASPGNPRAMVRAWLAGHTDTYAWAYETLAPAAAELLANDISIAEKPVDLMGHSLGSRTIVDALSSNVRRVLLLEGALLQRDVPRELPAGVQVLNICTRSDLVLRDLGSVFSGEGIDGCVGRDGLGRAMTDWKDIFLDDPATIAAGHARGWNLRSMLPPTCPDLVDALRAIGNHWACYSWPGNWALFRAFLNGDPLDDFGIASASKKAA